LAIDCRDIRTAVERRGTGDAIGESATASCFDYCINFGHAEGRHACRAGDSRTAAAAHDE
jgi:hypothetical protein